MSTTSQNRRNKQQSPQAPARDTEIASKVVKGLPASEVGVRTIREAIVAVLADAHVRKERGMSAIELYQETRRLAVDTNKSSVNKILYETLEKEGIVVYDRKDGARPVWSLTKSFLSAVQNEGGSQTRHMSACDSSANILVLINLDNVHDCLEKAAEIVESFDECTHPEDRFDLIAYAKQGTNPRGLASYSDYVVTTEKDRSLLMLLDAEEHLASKNKKHQQRTVIIVSNDLIIDRYLEIARERHPEEFFIRVGGKDAWRDLRAYIA